MWTVTDMHGNEATGTFSVTVNAPVNVAIADVYAVKQSTDNKNTLYTGYGPASLTVQATASGGTSACSWLWNTGQTGSSLRVNRAGTYTATATDARGGTAQSSITIKVVDVCCGPNGGVQ